MTPAPDNRSVLIVDDEPAIRSLLSSALSTHGFTCHSAPNGVDAMDVLADDETALVISDVRMPGISGLELLEQISLHYPDVSVILLTGSADVSTVVKALRSGACDFLTKPFTLAELRERVDAVMEKRREELALRDEHEAQERHLEHLAKQYSALTEGVLKALTATLGTKHPETRAHSERVALRAANLATNLGLSGEEVQAVYAAGLLHDLGKVAVDQTVLDKPGTLSDREMEQIRSHPLQSARIAEQISLSPITLDAIRHHHERFDGNGYPDHLAGDAIPYSARILAVCDSFDAMTSDRSYQSAMSYDEGYSRLRSGAGKQWDPRIVEVFSSLDPE